jgi:uncharacterized protein (TIGR02217 family)
MAHVFRRPSRRYFRKFHTRVAVGPITGTLAAVEAGDIAAAAGLTVAFGTLTATESHDVVASSGTVGTPADTGTLAATEANDAAAVAGSVAWRGALAATEAHDLALFSAPSLPIPAVVGLTTNAPRFGTPRVGFFQTIPDATDLVTSAPLFGTPVASQAPMQLRTRSPIFGAPSLSQVHHLIASSLITTAPALGTGRAFQILQSVIAGVFLPENIERDAKGGPRFNTSIFIGANGAEHRSANWPRQIGRWSINLGYRNDDDEDFLAVRNTFYACMGNAYGFVFRDWSDHSAVDQPMVAIPETELFQLQKVYSIGHGSFSRKITRPKASTVVVKLAGVVQSVTVEYSGGIITGATSDMTASFEFGVPVRFDTDSLEIDVEHDGLVNCPVLDLVEVIE